MTAGSAEDARQLQGVVRKDVGKQRNQTPYDIRRPNVIS